MGWKAKQFLLIDDDADDRDLFCEALSNVDPSIQVHLAENGKEGLDQLLTSTQIPHLIFVDVNMPVMDGWQCLIEIKAHKKLKDIPIIMYSTSAMKRDIDKAIALGASCFLMKPNGYDELQRALSFIVSNLDGDLALLKAKLLKKPAEPLLTILS